MKEKSYRNGNWQRLNPLERALYKASVGLARLRGGVVNASLLSELTIVIEKMLKTTKNVILSMGKKKAEQLKFLYRRSGVLVWMPQLEALLNDENYVLWLGNRERLVRSLGLYMPLT